MTSSIKCYVCHSYDVITYLHGVYDSEKTNVMECLKCGLQFLDPIMTVEEEDQYYKDYYKSQEDRHSAKKTLTEIQANSYSYHKNYKDTYSRYFNSSDISVLEIGAGTGGFIQLLIEDFNINSPVILERSQNNVEHVIENYPAVTVFDENSFELYDIIIAIGVFEHLRHPLLFLQEQYARLKNHGHLILEMPNKLEPLIELYSLEEFKKFNYQKQHYFTYSEASIKILCEHTKFKVEKFYYHQAYSIDNHISWLIHKKPGNYDQFTKLYSKATIKSYNNDLIENKTTDVIGVVLTK